MGKRTPSKEEWNNPGLFRHNAARRAKVRAVCIAIYFSMFTVLIITMCIIKFIG